MNSNFTEETCTGTGDVLTLAGATSGSIAFADSFADGDLVKYSLEDALGAIRVAGRGVFNTAANTITRVDSWNYNGTAVDSAPSSNIALNAGAHTIRHGAQAADGDQLDSVSLGLTPDSVSADVTLTALSSGFQVVAAGTTGTINITLPDATAIKNSAIAYLFENNGDGDLYVKDGGGDAVVRVSSGKSIGVNLKDNASVAGEWSSFGFNSGAPEGSAALVVNAKQVVEGVYTTYAGLTMLTPTLGVVFLKSDSVKAFVIQVNGTTVTAGTPTVIAAVTNLYDIDVKRINDTQALVLYADNNQADGRALVLDVSGVTVTAGTPFVFHSAYSSGHTCSQLTDNTFILAHVDDGNTSFIHTMVLTITGSTVTAGTPVQVVDSGSGSTEAMEVVALTATKALLYFSWGSVTNKPGACAVLEIAGTVVTVTPPVLLGTPNFPYHATMRRLTDTTALLVHNDKNNATIGLAYVITVTGTTFVKGVEVNFGLSGNFVSMYMALLSPSKAVVAYYSHTSGNGGACVLNIDGATVTAEAEVVYDAGDTRPWAVERVSDARALVLYEDGNNLDYVTTIVLEKSAWVAY